MNLEYCSEEEETFTRLRKLFVERDQALILATMNIPSRTMADFASRYDSGPCSYPDPNVRVAFWDALLAERTAILDNSVPSAYLAETDQGFYGGIIHGKTRFLCDTNTGWISSMVEPILNDLADVERLALDTSSEWFQRYLNQLRVFVDAAKGRFGISHFILIDGLNFVFELVGATQAYLETIERPGLVRQAIEFGFRLNCLVQDAFFEHETMYRGGTFSNMVQWIPGRIVSESVDPFHMTSVGYFEEWGRENVERMFSKFDGGVLHIHGNGRHILEAVATLEGLKAIRLGDDRGFPLAYEVLDELKPRVGTVPLLLSVPFLWFDQALKQHRLPGGICYIVTGVSDTGTANRTMDRVRRYRP